MNENENSLSSLDCWDYSIELECLHETEDLQLAAELGKTLLERNKELETALKHHQTIIEDQTQEIEYLTKQTVALREVNDSRLRIYEQLEVSIQDLERGNHRLVVENSTDKKHIKSLTKTIEGLEAKCDDLQQIGDDLRLQLDLVNKQCSRYAATAAAVTTAQKSSESNRLKPFDDDDNNSEEQCCTTQSPDSSSSFLTTPNNDNNNKASTPNNNKNAIVQSQLSAIKPNNRDNDDKRNDADMDAEATEQISQLLGQLRESRSQSSRDQRKIHELEEQLSTTVQQNQVLENQIFHMHHRDNDIKSMHEEFNTLEEVRKGQMCNRCLRKVELGGDETLEDDDSSMMEELLETVSQHRSSFYLDVQQVQSSPATAIKQQQQNVAVVNPYKDLVEKYEALLEVHHRHPTRTQKPATTGNNNNVSLQEELQQMSLSSSEFNSMNSNNIATINNTNNNNNINNINKDTDDDEAESGRGSSNMCRGSTVHEKTRFKPVSRTPTTDFSEAETSSSGFADEMTSNKGTQTDGGGDDECGGGRHSLLCTIAAAKATDETIISAPTLASRFKNRPEYQELFEEIFAVLKVDQENNKGGASTCVDDNIPQPTFMSTPILHHDQAPNLIDDELMFGSELDREDDDDSQSCLSSTTTGGMSISDLTPYNEPTTIIENIIKKGPAGVELVQKEDENEDKSTTTGQVQEVVAGTLLKPLVRRDPLEYLSVEVRKRRSSSSSRRNRKNNNKYLADRSDSPSTTTHIIGSPKINYSNRPSLYKRGGNKNASNSTTQLSDSNVGVAGHAWNGNTVQFWSRNGNHCSSPTPSQGSNNSNQRFEFKPSSASQDLHKLKKLDLSYAEVLRSADHSSKNKSLQQPLLLNRQQQQPVRFRK